MNSDCGSPSGVEKNKIVENTKTLEITGSGELLDVEEGEVMAPGGDQPTEEELATLRHVGGHIPLRCWLIAVVELSERFSYYGLSAPFQNYVQYPKDHDPAGVIGLGSQGATGLQYFFQFWCYVTPVFGGWLADTYLGKYVTISIGTGIYVIGIFILFITSLPAVNTSQTALGGYITSIILIGIATGMIKANLSVLIADQFPKRRPRVKTTRKGERVIEDPAVTIQNVFMFFYLMINIGSLSVIATTELEEWVGFWAAYLLPFCFFWIAVVVLIAGRTKYVRPPVGDRVIARSFKVFGQLIKHRFNYDAIKPSLNPERNYPWTDRFVEEMKRALSACKVFMFYPIYWIPYGQMTSSFVSVGGEMQLHGLPNDFFQAIDSIALIVFIPICEYLFYPFIRRYTPFRPITKIFWGFMFCSASMVWAAVLQHFIYISPPCYDHPMNCPEGPNDIHIGWQVPAYVLIALSEIFASITGLEYAYSKAPNNMKSFIMSIFLLTSAFGSAIGAALSPVDEDPKYLWMFTGLAIASFISGLLFWWIFHGLNDTEDAMNAMDYEENKKAEADANWPMGISDIELAPMGSGHEIGRIDPSVDIRRTATHIHRRSDHDFEFESGEKVSGYMSPKFK